MNLIASYNLIVPKYMIKVKQKGSKNPKARAREGGASAFTAMFSFISVPPSVRPKVLGAKPKQAGKKGGGWGEGIFARLLPFPSRPRKNMAEGGFGGNSAFPLLNQNEASPATCLNTWKAEHHRKILFSLKEEKIGRAQNEKSKEYFSVVVRAEQATAGLVSLVGVLLKECSNFVQKTPPRITFRKIKVGSLGASRLGMVFPRENPSIFEGERKRPLGNAEVPVRSTEKTKFSEPIFFLSPLAKGTAIFSLIAQKQTIWTT